MRSTLTNQCQTRQFKTADRLQVQSERELVVTLLKLVTLVEDLIPVLRPEQENDGDKRTICNRARMAKSEMIFLQINL